MIFGPCPCSVQLEYGEERMVEESLGEEDRDTVLYRTTPKGCGNRITGRRRSVEEGPDV